MSPNSGNRCAIELKFFKKENHREPNNRYDVFFDLANLEMYKESEIDLCFFMLGTDHEHYVNQKYYSVNTKDFDFKDGSLYRKGTALCYNTSKHYGPDIILKNDYKFLWDKFTSINFLKVEI